VDRGAEPGAERPEHRAAEPDGGGP
jgi:hypothetical protein